MNDFKNEIKNLIYNIEIKKKDFIFLIDITKLMFYFEKNIDFNINFFDTILEAIGKDGYLCFQLIIGILQGVKFDYYKTQSVGRVK